MGHILRKMAAGLSQGVPNVRIDSAANGQVYRVNTLDPAGAGHDRHDVDLQPAICLDPVHKILSGRAWGNTGRHSVDVLDFDHSANLAVAVAGLHGRQIWSAAAYRRRMSDVRRGLDHIGLRNEPDRPVFYLWPVLR